MASKLYFIAAVYNEQEEINDLINHVADLVDGYRIVDDESTDDTVGILDVAWAMAGPFGYGDFEYTSIHHTGLPETVKSKAKEMVPDGSWILMLDADERLSDDAKVGIKEFFDNGTYKDYDYVYFDQLEIIDGVQVRGFNKCKLFRKESVAFPLHNIHADDSFVGNGTSFGWEVFHRKTTYKQIQRETEYLATYKKLLDAGDIDEGRYDWLVGLHHFIKPS